MLVGERERGGGYEKTILDYHISMYYRGHTCMGDVCMNKLSLDAVRN